MRDAFWMEDETRAEWEVTSSGCERLFQKLDTLTMSNSLSFIDSQINEFVTQDVQFPVTDTGSQILDPLWRRYIVTSNSKQNNMQLLRQACEFHPQAGKSTSLPQSSTANLNPCEVFAS